MKRKRSPSAASVSAASDVPVTASARAPDTVRVPRRRQPQTSCDFCRQKKLKCDRSRPCSSCVARGQACHGGPVVPLRAVQLDPADVLERLRRLEQAVFSAKDVPDARDDAVAATAFEAVQDRTLPRSLPTPASAADLDYPSVGDAIARAMAILCRSTNEDIKLPDTDDDRFTFRVAATTNRSNPDGQEVRLERPLSPCVSLPCREDTLAMLECSLHVTPHCIVRAIHRPSARSAISNFYSGNLGVQQSHGRRKANVTAAAFILSICASAAFFWDRDAIVSRSLFASTDDAARKTKIWLNAAWDLLDQLAREPGAGSLEEVQAYLLLSDLVYNTEGCSTRYRYLHNRTFTAAREMSLHLIDAGQARGGAVDTSALTEIKRRIWWHIIATDWLLSTMGGPLDRTYRVHPRHMMVRLPRNVNDDDMATVLPADTITDMTFFLVRVRLAEVCRQVVDFLPVGCDIDGLPYDQVLAISQLFSDAMASLPPGFAIDAPMRPDAPPSSVLDRQIIHLAFHARLARILRSFLLTPDRQSPRGNIDPRCSSFRSLCLRSARAVLRTGSSLLLWPLEQSKARLWPLPVMHRSGCVISHMFMACVVLATHPKSAPGQAVDTEAEETIRLELADARRVLERAGEKSPMAASVVGKLVGVLKRHCLHGVGEHQPPKAGSASEAGTASSVADGTVRTLPDGTRNPSITLYTAEGSTAMDPQKGTAEQQPSPYLLNPRQVELSYASATKDLGWNLESAAGDFNAQAMDGIDWEALMDGAGFTGADSCGQLFADLDAPFPTPM